MKVNDLIELLWTCDPDADVVIPVEVGHITIGALPTVGVEGVSNGFDWDSGKVFLKVSDDKRLTTMSREEYSEHIRYKQLVSGLRGKQDIAHLSDVFVKKGFVIERLKRLINVEELESFEVSDLITDIYEEQL
ncbi:hypothetical protein [Salmonella phage SSBI34]|nr:hypothetical protein [Salmonella phage SSBI34]